MTKNLLSIAPEQWGKFMIKYNNLMLKISHMVTGDLMLCSVEDNLSELHMCFVEGVRGFNKLTGKSVEEMSEDPNFDKYIKTTLWHYKARKGANLTKKIDFRNKFKSIHSDSDDTDITFDIADTSGTPNAGRFADEAFSQKFQGHEAKILEAILDDPELMSEDGRVMPYALKKKFNISVKHIHIILKKLGVAAQKECHA